MTDIREIKAMLQGRALELARALLPGGRIEAGQYVTHNPFVAGDEKKTPALKIGLRRDPGAWRDWRNGEKGDVIDLVAFVKATDRGGALRWAREFLGLGNMSRAEREAMAAAAGERQRFAQAREQAGRKRRIEAAQKLFLSGEGILPDPQTRRPTPAEQHARAYWRARNCPLEGVSHPNLATFRFAAAVEYWRGAKWRMVREGDRQWREKESAGPEFPAILAAMRGPAGALACVHATFLDPVKPAKAPVTPAKLMLGEALGAVIEISTGPEGVPFWQAQAPRPLVLAEGIETALSLAQGIAEARIWACGSLAGIGHAPVDLNCVADVTVARDNNAGNAQAQRQLEAGLERLEETGKRVAVMASHVGDDFNDLMQGESNGQEKKA